jgi:phage gpG-like protein
MAALDLNGIPGVTVTPSIPFDLSDIGRQVLRRAGDLAMREAQTNARQFRDSGALLNSLQARATDMDAVIGSALPYAQAVEEGRRAGARQPPMEALEDWANRQGIDPDALYVIARAIGRRGIEGRLFLQRAYESVNHQMPGIMAAVAREHNL